MKMTEESGQRKVVGRTVVIVLGLICVVLAAGLVGVLAVYLSGSSNASEISTLKAENTALKGNMTSLTNQLATLQNSLNQANANLDSLRDQYDSDIAELNEAYLALVNLLNLNASATILRDEPVQLGAGENVTAFEDSVQYAGYFTVQVTSDSNTTFAQIIFSYRGFDFNNTVVVGESGTAAFAVLPGNVAVIIGNTEVTDAVTATVTVTYIY